MVNRCFLGEVDIGFMRTVSPSDFGPIFLFGILPVPRNEVGISAEIDDLFILIGGILVEVLKDVVFRVLPISRGSAKKMLSEIRSAPILNGV